MAAARAFTRTTTGDFITGNASAGAFSSIMGARLVGNGSAAASAQIQDANGNVLVNLASIIAGSDECDIEIQFEGKVTLAAIAGAGAAVTVYVS